MEIRDFNTWLQRELDSLDISPSNYKLAVDRYNTVGRVVEEWIKENFGIEVHIYPQGSFEIGTVIHPFNKQSGYDIDLVCEIKKMKMDNNQKEIKMMIKSALDQSIYKDMLDEEGRRCWTIEYQEQNGIGFHIDILPCVPENLYNSDLTAVATTTRIKKDLYVWDSTDPIAFSKWFKEINRNAFEYVKTGYKTKLFESYTNLYEKIEDVPDQLVKTNLQKSIQLLKRHRDIRFEKDKENKDKPLSMIITTLASQIYSRLNINTTDFSTTLNSIIRELSKYKGLLEEQNSVIGDLIQRTAEGWHIENPVANENLADRWGENNNAKAKAFFKWIDWLEKDFIQIEKKIVNENTDLYEYLQDENTINTPTVKVNNPTSPWGENG